MYPIHCGYEQKVSKTWDQKFRNRAQKKEVHREVTEEFHARLEVPRLLPGVTIIESNKVKHRIEKGRK